ncbi:MAG: hypothetical protein JWM20_368 [Patescibacteria group bacterium]|nr:hypothetical protein [Patescibacteria group bacterium]
MEKVSIHVSAKTLWTILLMIAGIFVAWKLRNFIMVVFVSVIIASFVEAGTRLLKRAKVPRPIAVFFFYILGFAILFGILYLIIPLFLAELSDFLNLFPKSSEFVKVLSPVAANGLNSTTLKAIFTNSALSGQGDFVGTLSGFFGGILNGILVVIISFYLAIQEKGIEQFLRVVVPDKQEDYVVDLWNRVERKIGYWFGGQVFVAILVGLVSYAGLYLMGVPYALILSALAFVFEFVPFGTALALAPAVILAYFGGGLQLAIYVFIFYGVLHYIDAYLLQPYILHRTIGMPMLVIILSIVACLELFGIIGVLVAIPIAVLILELIYDTGKHKKLPAA